MKTSNWAGHGTDCLEAQGELPGRRVVGLFPRYQATDAMATTLPIRRSPPSSHLRLSVRSMLLLDTKPNSTTNARAPPFRIQSSSLLDPATTPA